MSGIWLKQQVVSANTGAVAATSLNVPLTATQRGSLLYAIVACATSSAGITMPSGWQTATSLGLTNPSGGTSQTYYYQGNPGGITSVNITFNSCFASAVIYEFVGDYLFDAPSVQDISARQNNANGSAWAVTAFGNFASLNEIAIASVCYFNNAALTTSYNGGFVEDIAVITSGAGLNAGIRAASQQSGGNLKLVVSGTLSGTPSNGPNTNYASFVDSPFLLNNGNVGPATYGPGGAI